MEQEEIERWTVINGKSQDIELATDSLAEAKEFIKENLDGSHYDLIDERISALIWCSETCTMEELEAICE